MLFNGQTKRERSEEKSRETRTLQFDHRLAAARLRFGEARVPAEVDRFHVFDVQGRVNGLAVDMLLLTKSCRRARQIVLIDATPVERRIVRCAGRTSQVRGFSTGRVHHAGLRSNRRLN